MNSQRLLDEAMQLHRRIFALLLDEGSKRNLAGQLCGNVEHIRRLERIHGKTGDRWRRRYQKKCDERDGALLYRPQADALWA